MKIKHKLVLDAIMFFIIWLVMGYNFTGNLLHEILGTVLITGFLFHMLINRKYYFAMSKKIISHKDVKAKNIVSYAVNVLLLIASAGMIISSVAISRDLFAFANYQISSTIVWRTVHIICAVTILICVFVHVLLHASMFSSIMKRKIQAAYFQKLSKFGSGILAAVLAVGVVKMSYNSISSIVTDNNRKSHRNENRYSIVSDSDIDLQEEYLSDESQSVINVPTLEEYLKGLFCNGCGRHCSLLSPQCHKGVNKAEVAQTEYYDTYGEQ